MKGIDRFERAVRYLRKEVNEEIPAQQILLLITVSQQEGITQHALGEALGMLGGSVSRNVRSLAQWAERSKDGNLVQKGAGL